MTETANDKPIGVHVTGSDVPIGAAGGGKHRAVYQTVRLTSSEPAAPVLPQSDRRIIAFVQALDDDLIISGNQSDASNGAGATVPAANGSPWPVLDSGAVYAYAATYSGGSGTYSRVSVTAIYRS